MYVSAVAVEAAAREAADFGAFKSDQWTAVNVPVTTAEMLRRACVAAQGSHLEGYAGASDRSTCTNPGFSCTLEWSGIDRLRDLDGMVGAPTVRSRPPSPVHVHVSSITNSG